MRSSISDSSDESFEPSSMSSRTSGACASTPTWWKERAHRGRLNEHSADNRAAVRCGRWRRSGVAWLHLRDEIDDKPRAQVVNRDALLVLHPHDAVLVRRDELHEHVDEKDGVDAPVDHKRGIDLLRDGAPAAPSPWSIKLLRNKPPAASSSCKMELSGIELLGRRAPAE